MSHASQLSELLLRWRELRQQGQQPHAEELCAGCPELLDDLKKEMQALSAMEGFLGATCTDRARAGGPDPVTTQNEAADARAKVDIPGYTIVGTLGQGGMGVVYKAVQKSTKRTVALKVMLHGRHSSARQRGRFEREVEVVAALRHPNIVTVFDSGLTAEGLPYFAMEYIEGRPLDRPRPGDVAPTLAGELRLFAKICAAVNFAHQHGVMHRDLKPGNICIDAAGEPHILDFGLARTVEAGSLGADGQRPTMTGEFLGTPAFASPEQVSGAARGIDIRTDVYSLGVMLYHLLTGQFPYPVQGAIVDVFKAILETEPRPPSNWSAPGPGTGAGWRIDDQLEAIVQKALVKDPEGRYQSAGALSEDILRYLAGEPIQARPPRLGFLLRAWLKQNIRATVRTILVGLVCGGLSSLAAGMPRLLPILNQCAATYERLPGLARPWLAFDLALPSWLTEGLSIAGALAFVGMGLLSALLVRPKSRSDDMIAGLAAGLVGGITAFITTGGWGTVLGVAVLPAIPDLELLGDPALADKAMATRHLDLRGLTDDERQMLLRNKIIGDLVVGIPQGIWIGMAFTLLSFGSCSVLGTMVAGALIRRQEHANPGQPLALRYLAIMLPYLEATLPGAWLILLIYLQSFYSDDPAGWRIVVAFAVLVPLATLGILRAWPLWLRLTGYVAVGSALWGLV